MQKYILLFFYISIFCIYADTIPRKVMYYTPDLKFEGTIEKSIDSIVQFALNSLHGEGLINYAHDKEYSKRIDLYSLNDHYKLAEFFSLTNISASIDIQYIDELLSYKISIIINDFINKKTYLLPLNVTKENSVSLLTLYTTQIKDFILKNLTPFDSDLILQNKVKPKKIMRVNPDYMVYLTGAFGILVKEITDQSPYIMSTGPAISFDSFIKIKKFFFALEFSAGLTLSDSVETKVYSYKKRYNKSLEIFQTSDDFSFIPDLRASILFGGFIPNEIIGLGLGAKFQLSGIYDVTEDYHSNEISVNKKNYGLLFFYGYLVIKPNDKILLSCEAGSFFSPTNLGKISPSPFFPLYIKPSFRYFIIKNLFFDVSIPFYLISYDFGESEYSNDKPSSVLQCTIGLGWLIERTKK